MKILRRDKMTKVHSTINGLMLIDAPHSALNMLGQDEGAATENQVVVKSIQRAGQHYPYVSAQALRYWWRQSLESERDWVMSPIEREKKIAFTQAQPWKYHDDVFGYMRAQAEQVPVKDKSTGKPKLDERGKVVTKKGKNTTLTRVSPLKCSPLVSVTPQRPTRDFGTMSRHEGDPVPYERQFYSSILKGIFSLDLSALGYFTHSNKTGFQNISEAGLVLAKNSGAIVDNGTAIIPKSERIKRAKDVISVLPYITGGANQTLHLTDVVPKLLILVVLRGGNHLFMNVMRDVKGKAVVHIPALKEILKAYNDRLLTDVFIGKRAGFMDYQIKDLKELKDFANSDDNLPNVHLLELNSAVSKFNEAMAAVI